ncbi:histidine kinase [Rhodococcus sp. BP-349]|uniref:histidine kinase n=1 Tax=unclassified Rhodococcus (in: high G+C Gram-positive bacteria) TaxID=192944 RepID=UPI001C9B2F9E|nr:MULTISPECIES: histidine kinase [unclassified Rhodococcus (in: high G+C Gram-positive bacteria)]MBY6537349.1 histidine kinase [Rhodococcus sp. BP-363]MBY6541686.1 histidine kinase [Rhodococcus sp. BP-369]MBY6560916.1 histidine kinase [Rhodococcus sp. BP-370]MBY6575208.1 histidine kinase [Rhodococcus sp. BP-364]MBY6584509.1 histidine kinase [Rhodococcus sp. BP-358]
MSDAVSDRRNPTSEAVSTTTQFPSLPVTVVLDRIPLAVLAVEPGGTVVFANEAFDELMGFDEESPRSSETLTLQDIFPANEPLGVNIAETFLTTVATRADSLWRMTDSKGDILQVRASKSILRRAEDSVVLVVLEDFTDQLWNDPKSAFR